MDSQDIPSAGHAAHQSDSAGSCQLDDAIGPHQLDECLDLPLLPGDFDHDRFHADVHNAAAEHLNQQHDFHSLLRVCLDLDQHQVAFNEIFAADVLDLDDR